MPATLVMSGSSATPPSMCLRKNDLTESHGEDLNVDRQVVAEQEAARAPLAMDDCPGPRIHWSVASRRPGDGRAAADGDGSPWAS